MPEDKIKIRSTLLDMRRSMAQSAVSELSSIIQCRIINSQAFKRSSVVMAYMPIHNEVRTDTLLKTAMDSNKTILLPRVRGSLNMEAAPIKGLDRDIHTGTFGIREPDSSIPAMDPEIIDLVILPGIAFNRKGFRIGFGRGYYDRFIPSLRKDCILLAPAYGFQVIDHIPSDEYDQPVDMIVTEKETIIISSSKA